MSLGDLMQGRGEGQGAARPGPASPRSMWSNFGEMGAGSEGDSGAGGFMKKMSDMAMGTGGIAGGAAGTASKLAKVLGIGGKILGAAGGAAGAGALGYEVGSGINDVIDEKTQGKTSEGFEGNAVERLMFKLDKLFGGEASSRFMEAQKVIVEVDSKDPAYMARPKKTDNPRDSRGL
jgi:hypothetical protein